VRSAKGLAAAFAVFGLYWGAWAACLPAVQRATGASESQLGLALLCIALAALPAMLTAGRLTDLLGARVVPLALVVFGAATVLPGLAGSVPQLVAALVAVGVGSGALDVAVNARASAVEAQLGVRVMDGLHGAFSLGVVCGGVGAGLLRRAGAHPSWILAGVAALIAATALLNLDASARPPQRRRVAVARPLLVVGGVLALAFLVENGLEAWSALYLERTLDSSPAISGLGPGVFAGAMATGRLAAQRLALPSVALRIAIAGGTAAAGIVLAVLATRPLVALAGFAIAGVGLAVTAPTLLGLAGRLGGEGGRGAALSTVTMLAYLGFLAGPPLIGGVSGAVSSLRGGFLFLGAVALLLAGCAWLLRESGR
jgi:Major Facilitator Superfamily